MKNIICFDNYDGEFYCFSNWFETEFEADGKKFASVEQHMMYEKAMLFGNAEIAEEVLGITDPAAIKALGRKVRNYDDHLWNGMRQIVVYKSVFAKFSQNDDLKEKLLSTGDAFLAECEPSDKIWGIGMDLTSGRNCSRADWHGQNLLGYTLMSVRKELQK